MTRLPLFVAALAGFAGLSLTFGAVPVHAGNSPTAASGIAGAAVFKHDPMVSMSSAAAAVLTSTATAAKAEYTPSDDEAEFLDRINEERSAQGLAPLRFDPICMTVARLHSREMAAKKYFSHDSPTQGHRSPMERYLTGAGLSTRANVSMPAYLLVGENLFYSTMPGVDRGHYALMHSEGHRQNILDSRFVAAGVGVYRNSDGEYWVTEVFLNRKD